MASKTDNDDEIIRYDPNILQSSPEQITEKSRLESQYRNQIGELLSIKEIQKYIRKYSTTSTVFAEQSISCPDYQKTLYW